MFVKEFIKGLHDLHEEWLMKLDTDKKSVPVLVSEVISLVILCYYVLVVVQVNLWCFGEHKLSNVFAIWKQLLARLLYRDIEYTGYDACISFNFTTAFVCDFCSRFYDENEIASPTYNSTR